ncbi:hypothetical protein [Streptomyces lydicus]|uniref:hypothetical protein n=1 Tax=Streptomyces lydicus TaxID=47763 RepID=UPI0037D2336A
MPGHKETNVRLAPCVLEALAAVMARRGASRDETVRQLLAEHVEEQERKDPEDRITHISTVLRYPPPPRWRGDPRRDRPLRLRAPAGLLERARAVSLRLPGQHQRANGDYQARILTDAVTTAVAVAEPFDDDFLQGLLPLLRHEAALGLWRLTAAETSTKPERDLLTKAGVLRWRMARPAQSPDEPPTDPPAAQERQLLLAAEALENDVAWHSPARFEKAAEIARRLLTGPHAQANEELLYAQGRDFEKLWRAAFRAALRPLLREHREYDWAGRGGTAVWRAHRRVALQDFEDWLISREEEGPAEYVLNPPGWLLSMPPAWHAHAPVPAGQGQLPQPYAAWAAAGQVLVFPYHHRQAVWPLQRRPGPPGLIPVPGIEPLVTAATELRGDEVSGFIEALLIEWNHTYDAEDEPLLPIALEVPADKAHGFGYITVEEHHEAMAAARAATLARMDAVIEELRENEADAFHLQQLLQARGATVQFRRMAKRYGQRIGARFTAARASWRWPGPSVADEFLSGSPADLVQWLATEAYKRRCLLLEQFQQQAWDRAFDQYGRRV